MIDPKKVDINIRKNLKTFFIEEIIGNCPYLSKGSSKKNCLLILDGKTTKIIDKFMGVIDLIEGGIIGIEKLSCKRKKFPQFHAIYFIEPSDESIRFMMNDFLDERPEELNEQGQNMAIKGPLYDFAHIVFCNYISDFGLQQLTTSKNLVYATLSIRQVYLDISAIDENLFSLEFDNEEKLLTTEINEKHDKVIEELANKAVSMLTLVRKVENVQLVYQNKGAADSFAVELKLRVQKLVDNVYDTKITKQEYPPVFVVILNRGFDLLTPFMRDMTYASLYFNLLGKTEHKLEYEMELEKEGVVTQITPLNDTDTIWLNFKYRAFTEAFKVVYESFQNFVKKNSKNSNNKEQGTKSANDLVDEIRRLPQYQEFIKDYSKHINTMRKVMKEFSDKNFKKVFEYEQGVATGAKKTGDAFAFGDIKKTDITDPEDKMRLALIGHFAYGLDLEAVSKTLLDDNMEKMKFKTLTTIFDKAKEQENYKLELDEDSEPNNPKYYKPKIGEYLSALTKNKFFEPKFFGKDFKKSDIYPKNSKSRCFDKNCFKKTSLYADKDSNSVIIFFVIGGISYNEVVMLNNMQESKSFGDFNLIMGGTTVHSPYSLVKKYNDLSLARKEKAKKDREDKRKLKEEEDKANKNAKDNAMFAVLETKKDVDEDDDV